MTYKKTFITIVIGSWLSFFGIGYIILAFFIKNLKLEGNTILSLSIGAILFALGTMILAVAYDIMKEKWSNHGVFKNKGN